MREILFKGKRIANGEWYVGESLMHNKISNGQEEIYLMHSVENWTEVDAATLGQYTGLIDKNGKKIFENDIISTSKYGVDNGKGQNYSGKDNFVVGYADGTYYLENHLRRFSLRPDIGAEIIGNIYDNPELLK